MNVIKSFAQILKEKRGKPPKGKKWISPSVYMPAGRYKNVRDTRVRNPLTALQVNAMHNAWYQNKFNRGEVTCNPC